MSKLMALVFLLFFIGVPLIEIAVFVQVGGLIGLWPTLALVIATALAGTALLRHQGLQTLSKAQVSLERGQLPVAEVFEGLCLMLAGAFLLTPGFVTDAAGLLLFIPAIRFWLVAAVGRWLVRSGRVMTATGPGPGGPGSPHRPGGAPPVIEGDFEVVTEKTPPARGPSVVPPHDP